MNSDLRAITTALRAGSPVVLDQPPGIRHFLLQRYFDMSIRNGRLGVISCFMLLFGLAYEAPLWPRVAAALGLCAVLLSRSWLAGRLSRKLDPMNPRSSLVHDLLLLAGSTSWSYLPFVMQGTISSPNLFGVVYGAFVAVAVMSVSYQSALPASVVLVTCSFVPLVAFMVQVGTVAFSVLAFATTICVAALMQRVLSGHRTLLQSLAAERENSLLVRELQTYRQLLERENETLGTSLRDASRAASRDPLTGLYNRRYLMVYAEPLVAALAQSLEEAAVCVIDIDHFKRINDAHGHPVGDEVLRATAALLMARLREGDCLARYGGEEFVAVLRRCDIGSARRVAEALRCNVSADDIETEAGPVSVTVSVGVAQWGPGESFEIVMGRADRALYQAKHGGRDRVEIDPVDALRISALMPEYGHSGSLH